jgi:hypothetical protein
MCLCAYNYLANNSGDPIPLKGQCREIFDRRNSSLSLLPSVVDNDIGIISIFSKLTQDIRNFWCVTSNNDAGEAMLFM